jgi:hypothetical protein
MEYLHIHIIDAQIVRFIVLLNLNDTSTSHTYYYNNVLHIQPTTAVHCIVHVVYMVTMSMPNKCIVQYIWRVGGEIFLYDNRGYRYRTGDGRQLYLLRNIL